MITITDVSSGVSPYWEISDTTSNQPPEKVVYVKDDADDRTRTLKQIVELRKVAGYIDAGWQEGMEGVVYTLTPIADWLKSASTKFTKKVDCVTFISIIGSIASIVGVVLGIIALCKQ